MKHLYLLTHTLLGEDIIMSSASIYDWEKSVQSDPTSQFNISPSPIKGKHPLKDKSKGTIDYFIEKNEEKPLSSPREEPLDDLNDIGDLIFRKIVKLWKMKNL
jgi:hypothetical protein